MDTLNARFAIGNQLRFETGPGDLMLAEINNVHGKATVALQGAQLLHWTPAQEQAVIWLSPAARYVAGKAIRGGIPVCWPWFGPHSLQPDFPAHGIARTVAWEVVATEAIDHGSHRITLRLPPEAINKSYWPHDTLLECKITVGASLEMELITRNLDNTALDISEALHSYFAVSDVRNIQLHGLDGCDYVDKVDGDQRKRQTGAVTINGETDRVYLDSEAECWIDDPGYQRRIRISKSGSRTTVVWNPWVEKAATLGDLGTNGYLQMLCVESANALDNSVRLAPGAEHRLTVRYQVERLPVSGE